MKCDITEHLNVIKLFILSSKYSVWIWIWHSFKHSSFWSQNKKYIWIKFTRNNDIFSVYLVFFLVFPFSGSGERNTTSLFDGNIINSQGRKVDVVTISVIENLVGFSVRKEWLIILSCNVNLKCVKQHKLRISGCYFSTIFSDLRPKLVYLSSVKTICLISHILNT